MLKFSIDKQKLFVSKPIIYGLLIFLIDKLHTYLKGFELKTSLSIPLWEEERNVICARALVVFKTHHLLLHRFDQNFVIDCFRYGSCATPHDFEIYAQDASFEDPLMCAKG